MSWIKEAAWQKFRSGPWHRLKANLRWLWRIYSKATPDDAKDVLTLMSLCFVVALLSAVFVFSWMATTLGYGLAVSQVVASAYGTVAFLLLFLSHPIRCVFTMALPMLGSKEGRRLILSTSMMLLALNVFSNISANVGAIPHVSKCMAAGLTQSLINSSEIINKVKTELVLVAMKAREGDLQLARTLRDFDHFTYINLSRVNQEFTSISQSIERDFSHARNILKDIKLVANRLLSTFFTIYLFVESACYLKSYLTNVKFDNVYVPDQLKQTACDKEIQALPGDMKSIFCFKSCKISKREFLRCFLRIIFVSLYFVVTLSVISLDHIVYYLASTSKPWILDIPSISINISLEYKVQSYTPAFCFLHPSCGSLVFVDFRRVYPWTLSLGPERCTVELSEPDLGVTILLGLLHLAAYSMVFLEVFATRCRRAVSSSFFRRQEEIRLEFLYEKLKAKQRKESIFSIETHVSSRQPCYQDSTCIVPPT